MEPPVLFDLEHLLRRFTDPFNPESRFYWPLAVALGVALVANILWYYWKTRERMSPAENALRPWAFWINTITLIWVLVLLIAKPPFYWIALSFAVNVAILTYLYAIWLRPREEAWQHEVRRLKYIPQPERRRRRRRR